MQPNNQPDQPAAPPPTLPEPTPGTAQVSTTKTWIPRLVIAGLLSAIAKTALKTVGGQYQQIGETILTYINIAIIIAFVILIIKIISEKNNAKN